MPRVFNENLNAQWVRPEELKTRQPFDSLFPIEPKVLEAIAEDMDENGYDPSKTIDIMWDGTVVDGHTRLAAALQIEQPLVTVFAHKFECEEDAIEFAIHNQRDRRNLTDADILRCVAALDRRKQEGRPEKTTSSDVVSGRSSARTAAVVGTSSAKVERARTVLDSGDDEIKQRVEAGETTIHAAYNEVQARKQAGAPAQKTGGKPLFNRVNDNIEWASWSWNPVTGCEHDCEYCYARDIAKRFYPQGFEPTFHPDRLDAPQNMRTPKSAIVGDHNVFVCSMADLFGKWVPDDWIRRVLERVEAAPHWHFLFLTKNPGRYRDYVWPGNAWLGTTVDTQARVAAAERAFAGISAGVKWLSCEPMRERLTFKSLDVFDWVVIGGQSKSSKAPEFQPEWEWVEHLMKQARAASCKIYFKPNLTVRPREYPGAP